VGLGVAVRELFVEHAWREAYRRDLTGLGRSAWGRTVGAAAGGLATAAGMGTSGPEARRAITGLTRRASSRLGPAARAPDFGCTSGPADFGRSATSACCACAGVGTTRSGAGAAGTSLASDRGAAAVLERAPCARCSGLGCSCGSGRIGSSLFGPGTLLGCASPACSRPGLRMGGGRDPGGSVHQLAAAWGAGEPIVGRAAWR
jgi:hypothetical protein